MTAHRGFTLVEVLVALVILDITMLAATSTLVAASRMSRASIERERAVAALAWVYDSLVAESEGGQSGGPGAGEGSVWVGRNRVDWVLSPAGSLLLMVPQDDDTLRLGAVVPRSFP